jgi:thiol-disulfide isomerase/thioredoxin
LYTACMNSRFVLLGIGIIVLVLIAGYFLFFSAAPAITPDPTPQVSPLTGSNKAPGVDTGIPPVSQDTFHGTVLAGTTAPLLDFTSQDFELAKQSDKLIVLYFYANWCPICRAEFPLMEAAFNELANDQVVGFRVNYNDNETDEAEKALAREHGVAYQHTKVFVHNGQRVLKSPETWDKSRYLSEINAALQKN